MSKKITNLKLFQKGNPGLSKYNSLFSAMSQVTVEKTETISGVASQLIAMVTDEKLKKALLVDTSDSDKEQIPLIYELLKHSFNFEKNESQSVSLCKSALLFNGSADTDSVNNLVTEFNTSAEQLMPSARLHCRKQPGGICFQFELLC